LRPGNVHSAEGWDEVLLPIIDRYRRRRRTVVVRADAAFAMPALYEALERRGVRYAIRLPANDVLERQIEDLLTRPGGRPSHADPTRGAIAQCLRERRSIRGVLSDYPSHRWYSDHPERRSFSTKPGQLQGPIRKTACRRFRRTSLPNPIPIPTPCETWGP